MTNKFASLTDCSIKFVALQLQNIQDNTNGTYYHINALAAQTRPLHWHTSPCCDAAPSHTRLVAPSQTLNNWPWYLVKHYTTWYDCQVVNFFPLLLAGIGKEEGRKSGSKCGTRINAKNHCSSKNESMSFVESKIAIVARMDSFKPIVWDWSSWSHLFGLYFKMLIPLLLFILHSKKFIHPLSPICIYH